jgi:hypothetical protein
MNAYEDRMAARRARLEARVARLNSEAAAQWRKGDLREEVSGIPFGQPILVGHHSEGRHRRAIARAERAMDRAVELMNAAERAENSLAGIGHGGISSDDPGAIDKLRAKVAELEERAENENRWNKQLRKGGVEALDCPAELKAQIAGMVERYPHYLKGYFFVNNVRAKIRDAKARIARLERDAARPAAPPVEVAGGIRIVENAELNRLQILFPDKPDADARAKLKRNGFRWAPSEGAWQRQLNNAARYAAQQALA